MHQSIFATGGNNTTHIQQATGTPITERKLDDENFWYEEVIKLRDRGETLEGDLKKEKDLNKRLQRQILRFMENRGNYKKYLLRIFSEFFQNNCVCFMNTMVHGSLQSLQPGSIAGNRNSMRVNPPVRNPLGIYCKETVHGNREQLSNYQFSISNQYHS